MVGIIIGTVCLIGLVRVARGHRRWHGGHGGCRTHRGHGRSRRREHRDRLDDLYDHLDVTDDQEKVIETQLRAFRKSMKSMRGERSQLREDVARAMRSDSFDENIMGDMFVRHDDLLRELRKQGVETLAHIHNALDERQRDKLASYLESGRSFRFGGPYR